MYTKKNKDADDEYHHSCPGCGSGEITTLETANERRIFLTDADEISVKLGVCGCEECGLTFLNPRMGQRKLFEYYAKQSRIPRVKLDKKSPFAAHMQLQLDIIEKIKPFETGKNALEIGCAEGFFLQALRNRTKKEFGLYGVELSEKYIEQARLNVPDITIFDTALENMDFNGLMFDFIILRHVFEHLSSPSDSLHVIRKHLAPGGILYIEVPDSQNVDPTVSRFYHHEHLNYFSPEILEYYLGVNGFSSIVCERFEGNPLGSGFSYPVIRSVSTIGNTIDKKKHNGHARDVYNKNRSQLENYLDELLTPVRMRLKQLTECNKQVGLFGAGPHTMDLLDFLAADNITFTKIFDNNPNKHGKRMRGTPIVEPDSDSLKSVDSILISSAEFETQMIDQVKSLVGSEVEIIPIYKKDYLARF